MALAITEFLDNLYTTTWQNMKSEVADNIFNATPFWFWLKDKGKLREVQGGRWISEPLQYFKNDNISWLTKGGTVNLNDFEFLTIAQYFWRYVAASIVRFGIDDQQNRGKNQIISLMNAKMENSKNALIDTFETALAGGAGSSDNKIDGLQFIIPDDPTAANYAAGGIDGSQAQYAWWRNQSSNMTGKSFATYGVSAMRTMLNDCSNNLKQDTPDIILSDQTTYERYEESALGVYQIINKSLADMGFDHQTFKSLPMIWSPAVSERMYFLNTRFFSFVYDPAMYFDMTEWKAIPDQVNDRAAQIICAAQMTVSRRRCHGVLYNLDTD